MNHTYSKHVIDAISIMLFIAFIILIIRHQYYLLEFMEWGDESETIVVSKLLASGGTLYSEVFSQHGPLIFAPGLILEFFGDHQHKGFRAVIAIGQLLTLLSIYFSPIFKSSAHARAYTTIAAIVLVVYMNSFFAHMFIYHTIAGMFLVVILAQYTLPSIAAPNRLTSGRVYLGNFLIASLPFLAISYLPAALLLFVASLRKQQLSTARKSIAIGLVSNILILIYIGSILGYIAIHLYLNVTIYSSLPHTTLGSFNDIFFNVMDIASGDLSKFLIFTTVSFSLIKLSSYENEVPFRTILVAIAILSLTIRGGGFHGLPYYYSALALPIVLFLQAPPLNPKYLLATTVFLIFFLAKVSLTIPKDDARLDRYTLPKSTEFSKLVQLFTNENDRIISYSFKNYEYLAAQRLPASGHVYYLPQQEMYRNDPILGIKIRACEEIDEYRPKVMLVNKWNAWGKFHWGTYGKCIQKIINKHYIKVVKKPYYIRRDILEQVTGQAFTNNSRNPSLNELMSMKPNHNQ